MDRPRSIGHPLSRISLATEICRNNTQFEQVSMLGRQGRWMNKRIIGTLYETKAAEYLERAGYHILERNYRCRMGEIDLIALHQGYLVFVEVKFRKDAYAGYGAEAVDWRKQKRIIAAARWYLMEKHRGEIPCRFDVLSFLGEEIQLIQDAFWC